MFDGIRKVALLMLIAGICLGVFASTLVARKHGEQAPPQIDKKLEGRVQAYRQYYELDDQMTNDVREVLQRHQRRVYKELQKLRRENDSDFVTFRVDAEERIEAILEGAGKLPAGSGDAED